jgi:hypothetical protein
MKTIFNIRPEDKDAYESFLLEFEDSLLYQSWKYKQFVCRLLDCELVTLLLKDDAVIVGALPLMKTSGKYGVVYNALPFYGSNGGIITRNQEDVDLLIAHYNELVVQEGVASATLVTNPLMTIGLSALKAEFLDSRIGQFSTLGNEEDVLAACHYKTRNMIRKAMKSEITVVIDNNSLDFLEEQHSKNMEAVGGIAKTHQFFTLISECFEAGADYNVFVALIDEKPVAALLVFYFNDVAEYFTPVIDVEFRSLQPMSLLIKEAMVHGHEAGYSRWNWGGTWKTQEGVYRFKSRWGSEDIEYSYHTYVNNREILNTSGAELIDEYPNFYVVPFSALKEQAIEDEAI